MVNVVFAAKLQNTVNKPIASFDANAEAFRKELTKAKAAQATSKHQIHLVAGRAESPPPGAQTQGTASLVLVSATAEAKSTPFTAEQLAQIKESYETKGVAATWDLMASFGDTYAKAAAAGIKDPTSYYGQVIRHAWYASGADFGKFDDVAKQHQRNYIDIISKNLDKTGVGTLPTTTQVEKSYYQALDKHGISPLTAIDLLFTKIHSVVGTPNWHDNIGGLGLGLEADRKGPPSEEAKSLSLDDTSGRLGTIMAHFANTRSGWAVMHARANALGRAEDALIDQARKLTGDSSIESLQFGGLKIYINRETHTMAMFDQGGNGWAWIGGEWQRVDTNNWRPDPDQSEGLRKYGPEGEIYQYKNPATDQWKRASLSEDASAHRG